MKIVNQEMDVNPIDIPKQDPLDDTEDFENTVNPLELLEVSPVDTICSPGVNDDVNIVVFEKSPFRCTECYVAFPAYASFRYHVIVRHGKDPVVLCDVCGVPCSSAESQEVHKKVAHAPEPPEREKGTKKGKNYTDSDKIVALKQGNKIFILKKLSKADDPETPVKKGTNDLKGSKKRTSRRMKREADEGEEVNSDSDFSPDDKELRYSDSVVPRTYNFRCRNKKLKSKPELPEEETEPEESKINEAEDKDPPKSSRTKKVKSKPGLPEEETEPEESKINETEDKDPPKRSRTKKLKSKPELPEEETEPAEAESKIDEAEDKGPLKCQDCSSKFHSERGLESHRITKHGYNPPKIKAKCEGCGKEFGSLSVYRRHGPEQCTLKSAEEKTTQNGRKRKS